MERHVFANEAEAASQCALAIAELVAAAVESRGLATFAVSGGSTPRLMLRKLAKLHIPWHAVHLFWADERAVPPTDEQSNYRMVREELIERVPLVEANVHRIHGEIAPAEAAAGYEGEVQEVLGAPLVFDVVQLGLGADAHIASLFPGDLLLTDRERVAAAVFAPSMQQWRITLCPRVLCAARRTVFLVSGAGKAAALNRVFREPYDASRIPGQLAREFVAPVWFLDRAAAGETQ